MKLVQQHVENIIPTAPFNFDATFHKPAHFPTGDNYWKPGARWQTFHWQKKNLGVIFKDSGTVTKPKITVEIFGREKLSADFITNFLDEIRYRFSLNLDLLPFYQEFSKDKILAPVIKRISGMRPGHEDSLYEYLVIGIVLQNCTVRRSIAMMQALFENFGTLLEFDGKNLWCFWQPGRFKSVTEEKLRKHKLGYRAKFIKRIDWQFSCQEINQAF